jgi:transposase-like protein
MLSLSLGHSQVIRQTQTIRLTQSQRLAVTNYIIGLRIDLAGSLAGVKYYPENSCPTCHRVLKLSEILKGYSDDPKDLRTTCPKCKDRFVAKLRSDAAELRWYCPNQALSALQEDGNREMMKPEEILRWNASVYHSLLTHFGSVTNAFKKLGVTYTHGEVPNWHSRVRPFLGKLPDTVIAETVGVSRNIINALRKSFGINAFNRGKLAEKLT